MKQKYNFLTGRTVKVAIPHFLTHLVNRDVLLLIATYAPAYLALYHLLSK